MSQKKPKWDGKSRVSNDKYRKRYSEINWSNMEEVQRALMEHKEKKMGYSDFVTAKHLLYKWGYKIDNSIESETIFVHRYYIKRDWDKGKKQQRQEDPLRPQLDPDYSQYEDKKETDGPNILSDGNSAYRIYEDEDKDDNNLE